MINNKKSSTPKYSQILISIIKEFKDQIPDNLSFDETINIVIDAWNLANNFDVLPDNNLLLKELESYKFKDFTKKIVTHKINYYKNLTNIIIGYEIRENNIFQIKTQTREEHFNDIARILVNSNTPNITTN